VPQLEPGERQRDQLLNVVRRGDLDFVRSALDQVVDADLIPVRADPGFRTLL
jgi:hypothetical protein